MIAGKSHGVLIYVFGYEEFVYASGELIAQQTMQDLGIQSITTLYMTVLSFDTDGFGMRVQGTALLSMILFVKLICFFADIALHAYCSTKHIAIMHLRAVIIAQAIAERKIQATLTKKTATFNIIGNIDFKSDCNFE